MFAQMVDFSMLDHISTQRMEEFCARALSHEDFATAARHMARCETCQRAFRETSRKRRDDDRAVIDLSLENWFKDEHPEYERMIAYAGGQLDEIEREITEAHLRACPGCREDGRGFLEYKRRIEPWIREDGAPEPRRNSWKIWDWFLQVPKPAFAAPIAAAAAVTIIALLLYRSAGVERRPDDRLVKTSPSPSLSTGPSASPAPKYTAKGTAQFPETTPTQNSGLAPDQFRPIPRRPRADLVGKKNAPPAEAVVLNDGDRKITLSGSGSLTGVDNLSPELQQSIKEFLLATDIKRPDILSEINGVNSALRGTDQKQSFKLLSPAGVVIAEDRPVFKWEGLEGATAYRVEISDSPSRAPISSEQLLPNVTQWTPGDPLRRGKIYSWIVIATVDGKEVVSPSASMPEAKFKVLGEAKIRELEQLKRANSHLALGVFYAREGMTAEAEKEFQILVDSNPQSSIVQRLLRMIGPWK